MPGVRRFIEVQLTTANDPNAEVIEINFAELAGVSELAPAALHRPQPGGESHPQPPAATNSHAPTDGSPGDQRMQVDPEEGERAPRGLDRFSSVISRIERMAAMAGDDDAEGSGGDDSDVSQQSHYEDMEGFIDDEELEDHAARRKVATGHTASDFHICLGGEQGIGQGATALQDAEKHAEAGQNLDDAGEKARELLHKKKCAKLGESAQAALEALRLGAKEYDKAKRIPEALNPLFLGCAIAMKAERHGGVLVKAQYEAILEALPFTITVNTVKERIKKVQEEHEVHTYNTKLEESEVLLVAPIEKAVGEQENAKAQVEAEAAKIREENARIAILNPPTAAASTAATSAAKPGAAAHADAKSAVHPDPDVRAPGSENQPEGQGGEGAVQGVSSEPATGEAAAECTQDPPAPDQEASSRPLCSAPQVMRKVPVYKFKWSRELEDRWAHIMEIEVDYLQYKLNKSFKPKKGEKEKKADKEKKGDKEEKKAEKEGRQAERDKEEKKQMVALFKKWVPKWPPEWLDWQELRRVYLRAKKRQAGPSVGSPNGAGTTAKASKRKGAENGSGQTEKKRKAALADAKVGVSGSSLPKSETQTPMASANMSTDVVLHGGSQPQQGLQGAHLDPRKGTVFDPVPDVILQRWQQKEVLIS